MSQRVVFRNANIFDGSCKAPFAGEVEVTGQEITAVRRGRSTGRTRGGAGEQVIDCRGATLMPGLCDAHTHFSWNDQPSLSAIQLMPPEEHTLWCAQVAEKYLDMGFTSCVGAAAAKPRLDVVIRNAINGGQIPGPRYLANSQEIATVGGLGDVAPPHIEHEALSFGAVVSGPEEVRRMVRRFIKYGVDLIKLNLSGEEITGVPSAATVMSDEECAIAVKEAHGRGLRVCAHARSGESVRMCVRHGIEIIYHASFVDDDAIRQVVKQRDQHFVAPGLAWLVCTAREAAAWGIVPGSPLANAYEAELAAALNGLRKMHRKGVRILPGGDYGFAWTPHGRNARDLEYFVDLIGMSSMEALLSATRLGGEIMGQPDKLGQIRAGYLADLILVDGDPLREVRILQDRSRILAVMKGGSFYRAPGEKAWREPR
ncbi:MAG: amidohydrolase family protein [Gammaproteobacteria bacterium]|nr:amidohydrolase family protein [Gammaproteobacteria bacterium]